MYDLYFSLERGMILNIKLCLALKSPKIKRVKKFFRRVLIIYLLRLCLINVDKIFIYRVKNKYMEQGRNLHFLWNMKIFLKFREGFNLTCYFN